MEAAGAGVIEYIRAHVELGGSPWGFDRGKADHDYLIAVFSCTSVKGWGRDKLYVHASKTEDGAWHIQHTLERGE